MAIDRNSLRSDPWGSSLVLIAVLFVVFASAALVIYTRRIEFAILGGTPVALLLLSNYRLATMVTVWVVLIWMLRWPFMFFEVLQFSYVVYASVALTIGAYLLRLASPGRRHLPLTGNGWLWLLVGTVIAGGVHGASNVGSIPPWLLSGPDADLGVPWIYYRTVVLPGVLLPLIAILVGASICDKEKPTAMLTPVWTLVCATAALIVGEIILSGEALSVIATQRSEHLTVLGFHSNEFGTFLAIAYGLSLGVWNSAESGRDKKRLGAIVVATGIALLLTFSRGAYLAFAVTNVVVFMGSSPKKRAAFLLVTLLLALAAPAPLVDRAGYGLTTRDANEISAGRVDNLWVPLLPNIADHLWVGQGLQSIMWTEAQLFQQIYPVNHAHNAFIDLLLDLGVLGAIPVLVWYAYVWREFVRRAKSDPDPEFRTIFIGGHLALLSFFLCALTNNRLTPTAPTCLLWVVMGVLLGRVRQKAEGLDQIAPETTSQRKWRPLVAATTMTRTTA